MDGEGRSKEVEGEERGRRKIERENTRGVGTTKSALSW
jgi:hypothetical protein